MSRIEIANYSYFLQVLERDMKDIKENITREMDVIKKDIMEKLKSFRENVSGDVHAGAGIAKNHEECLQDIAAMSRKTSLLKNAMEYELGIQDGLHADKKKTQLAMSDNYKRRHMYTKKGGLGKDGKRTYILVSKHRTLSERPATPPTPSDEEE